MFGFIVALAGWIWDAFQAVSDAVVVALVAAYHFLLSFGLAIWDAAKFTYQDILKPVALWLDKVYTRFAELYRKYVQPAIDWLDRVTKTLRKLYFTLLAPIFAVIDGVKKTLALLALLHVQFAQKLETELSDLERKLSLPLQLTIRFLNGLINRVESYVLTTENLFQRVTNLGTLRRDLTAVQNIQWGSLLRNLQGSQKPAVLKPDDAIEAEAPLQLMEDIFNGNDDATQIDVEGALSRMEQLAGAAP